MTEYDIHGSKKDQKIPLCGFWLLSRKLELAHLTKKAWSPRCLHVFADFGYFSLCFAHTVFSIDKMPFFRWGTWRSKTKSCWPTPNPYRRATPCATASWRCCRTLQRIVFPNGFWTVFRNICEKSSQTQSCFGSKFWNILELFYINWNERNHVLSIFFWNFWPLFPGPDLCGPKLLARFLIPDRRQQGKGSRRAEGWQTQGFVLPGDFSHLSGVFSCNSSFFLVQGWNRRNTSFFSKQHLWPLAPKFTTW